MELFSCCPVKGKTEFLSPFNGLASKYLRRWLMCRNSISVAVKCHWWLCNICQHNLQGSLVSTKGSSGNYGYLLMLHISILSRSSIGMCAESKESVLAEWPLSITQNWGSLWGAFPAPYLSRADQKCPTVNLLGWLSNTLNSSGWILAWNSKFLGLYLPLQCLISSVWGW